MGSGEDILFYDGVDQTERAISSLDHISFHKDGTIHTLMKDASGNRDILFYKKLRNPIGGMPKDSYAALLIYSVHDYYLVSQHLSRPSHLAFKDVKNADLHFEAENIKSFSIVVFLLGIYVDPKSMLITHFPTVFIPGNSYFLEGYLEDKRRKQPNYLNLLVAFTTKTIPKPPANAVSGSETMKNAARIENLTGLSLACSDEKIRQMV